MAQASTKDEDICMQFNDDFVYNVFNFLRQYDNNASSKNRIKTFDEFIKLLDAKVYINTHDPRY